MSQPRSIALVMLGDVMLGRQVDKALSSFPAHGVWGDMLGLLQGGMAGPGEVQCNAANLECALTCEEARADKTFNFKLNPGNAWALSSARLAFVSLANNHVLDYLEPGLVETMQCLRQADIACAGAGTAAQAAAPAVVECGGLRLAFFAFSDHPDEWTASEDRLGINFIDPDAFDHAAVQRLLDQARDADLRVVFIHWGPNWRWEPSAAIRRLAHAFVDCGADVVFGTSPHHIQGIEVWRGRPIVYGAGGFIDDYRLNDEFRNDLGFLYRCHITSGRPHSLELVPSRIKHAWLAPGTQPPYVSSVERTAGGDREWLCRRLRELCEPFGTRVEECERGLLISLTREAGVPAEPAGA